MFENTATGAGAGKPIDRARLRILVVEDNPVHRLLLVRVLEKAGHQTVAAGNGREGLDALDRQAFDLVLMDVEMPVMDGFAATACIRQRESGTGNRQPILAVTAHAEWGDRERCLEAGMDGYVAKPIQVEQMFAAIATATAGPTLRFDGPEGSIGARILKSLRNKSQLNELFEYPEPEAFLVPPDFNNGAPAAAQN